MKQFRSDEGAVAVIVAFMLVVFVGFSALVIDMGYWYTVRRQLQTAADAAALAGCRELSDGKDNATIWAAVEDYVEQNRVNPIGATVTIVPPAAGGESDIAADSVKVTVSTVSTAFFGKLLGKNDNTIRAQARAKIGWIAGARNAVPWGLPILRSTKVVVKAGGGAERVLTYDSDDRLWRGTLPAGSSGDVSVIAYNDQVSPDYPNGVPQTTAGVARILQRPASARIVGVHLNKQIFAPGETGYVTVTLASALKGAEDRVELSVSGKDPVTLTGSGVTYTGSFSAPASTEAFKSFGLDVAVMAKKKPIDTVALLFGVRRSTYPIEHVTATPVVFPSDASGATQIAVKMNEYEYGLSYPLKVGVDGETGKFGALDFGSIYASYPGGSPVYDLPSGASTYKQYLGQPPYDTEAILEIGNVVLTENGDMVGPTDEAGWRCADGVNFAQWEAAGYPQPTDHLVLVPVTERIDEKNGSCPLRVVSFAWFYLEDIDKGEVTGVFVEDATAPGLIVVDNPPNHLAAQAVHLVSEDVKF